MSRNIPSRLLVVSDTSMRSEETGVEAFEPVVRELESLSPRFDEILWLGFGDETGATALRQPGVTITPIPMRRSGAGTMLAKASVVVLYPYYLMHLLRYLRWATHVHSRGPSHPALVAIIVSLFDRKRVYWHKYAGNWRNPEAPRSYRFQRWLLNKAAKPNIRGTINGSWPGQRPHLISMENPCLSEREWRTASEVAASKEFRGPARLLFVGGLHGGKGIDLLIQSLAQVNASMIAQLLVVGDGPLRSTLEARARNIAPNVRFLGVLKRAELDALYASSHFVVLPSLSEGFPKVIAEGAAYGCIPVLTDLDGIDQTITDGVNGFLIPIPSVEAISATLNRAVAHQDLAGISARATETASTFTYERFVAKLNAQVFCG